MNASFKKLCNDYGIIGILCVLVVAYVIYKFGFVILAKGKSGHESMGSNGSSSSSSSSSSNSSSSVTAAGPLDSTTFTEVANSQQTLNGSADTTQDPSNLLPKDNNSQWAQLNSRGSSELQGANLLKAGQHMGIDTVGSSLRNPNQQLRSDPPITKTNTGPWMQSTMEGDPHRKAFEIGGNC